MKLYAFSDLHITSPRDSIYDSLCDLIRGMPQAGDVIVFAGDIFDLFIGTVGFFYNEYTEFFISVESAIQRGVSVYYIQGNHDFQMDDRLKKMGVKISEPELSLSFGDKKFYIAHGDLVDDSDYGYLILRKTFRSTLFKRVTQLVSSSFLDQLGKKISQISRVQHPVRVDLRVREKFRSFAIKKLQNGYDFVILGHCHDLDEMTLEGEAGFGHYINMGYPKTHGKYLTWEPGLRLIERVDLPIGKLE